VISGSLISVIQLFEIMYKERISMKIGDIVCYRGEKCEIIYLYESGYCEIKRPYRLQIQLVSQSELGEID